MSGKCAICGTERWSLDRDHIIPKVKGGTDDPSNIQWICQNCHHDKTHLRDRVNSSPEMREKFSIAHKTSEKCRQHIRNLTAQMDPEERSERTRRGLKTRYAHSTPEDRRATTEAARQARWKSTFDTDKLPEPS